MRKHNRTNVTSRSGAKLLLERIASSKDRALIKKGTFSMEIIWGGKSYIFPQCGKREHNKFKRGLFLFGMVRRDAAKFLRKKNKPETPKENKSMMFTEEERYDKRRKICATDLNHAYWRIALNLGIISPHTYEKGLDPRFKATRLAALSTLGAGRTYQVIEDGQITNKFTKRGGGKKTAAIYHLIRMTCFYHMTRVKKMLGKEFLAYKTDCIYYYDTPNNRAKVQAYFGRHELDSKQLS